MAIARFQNLQKSPLFKLSWGNLSIWGLILFAWAIVLLITLTGQEYLFHYQMLFESDWHLLLKLFVFLLSWQVMTVAMMLPSSLPLIQLFAKVTQQQEKERSPVLFVFIAAYLTIWTGFALVAFSADLGLHQMLDALPWLAHRPWLLSGTTILLAGAFQFSNLKQQCLKACRHPFSFLTHHYQRGSKAAWNLGIHHGLYCLGCCWALMLIMFSVGVGHLGWMLVLTGVMTIEKTSPWSKILIPLVGVGLIILGVVTIVHSII
jgi:predicted metal-binding membrane protein